MGKESLGEAAWQRWKRGFETWEGRTAKLMASLLKSPKVLEPAAALLTASLKAKKRSDDALAQWWIAFGLPTRRDQERMLHLLNQVQGRLYDLEERLADAEAKRPGDGKPAEEDRWS